MTLKICRKCNVLVKDLRRHEARKRCEAVFLRRLERKRR